MNEEKLLSEKEVYDTFMLYKEFDCHTGILTFPKAPYLDVTYCPFEKGNISIRGRGYKAHTTEALENLFDNSGCTRWVQHSEVDPTPGGWARNKIMELGEENRRYREVLNLYAHRSNWSEDDRSCNKIVFFCEELDRKMYDDEYGNLCGYGLAEFILKGENNGN